MSSTGVEFLTYTFIALPGILLGFSALQSLVTGLAASCCKGKSPAKLQAVANFVALFIQVGLSAGLFYAGAFHNIWTEEVPPSVTQGYEFSIKAMSYVSAILVIGVKMLGVISHGPQTKHLVLRTTGAETRYEAATQLCLVASIYFTSGTWTTRSLFSAISSILVIGKVGVESFFKELEQDGKLSKASLMGKISVATSVLPVFVLTALFKIGTIAITFAWDRKKGLALTLLAPVPPSFVIFLIKTCVHLEDLSIAAVSQGIVSELVSLHLWPCRRAGKRIGMGVTIFKLLLFSFVLAWIIGNPESGRVGQTLSELEDLGAPLVTETLYEEWARETATRFKIASISCFVIGWLTLPLIIGQVFYQDIYIEKLLNNCLNVQEEEVEGIEMMVEKGEINAMKQVNEIGEDNEIKEEDEVKEENEKQADNEKQVENEVEEIEKDDEK